MSIDMFVTAAQSQASSVSAKCQADQAAYEHMIQALQQFIDEDRLDSAAYRNAKQYFSTVLIPLVQAGILLSEAVAEACQKFVDEYHTTVDSGDLKSEDLEERIRQLDDSIRSFEAIRVTIEQSNLGDNFIERQLNQNSRMIESLVDTKKVLQDKLEKLLSFHASSPQLFANIAALEALVNQGASQTESAWTGNSFTIPKDLQWTTTVSEKWQLRQEKLKKQEQEIQESKIKELKQYKVYAVIYIDAEGNPAILWQLEKDGKGVTNPELYQYLDKEGINLSPDLFELIDYNSWNEKIQNGWRNGYNYVTGETYNPALGGIIATSQYIQDGVTWLNETDIGLALQTLGFTYVSYRMMTNNGLITVENEKVSETKIPNVEIKTPLGKNIKKHISKHDYDTFKKQADYLTDSQLAQKLEKNSFFNPEWSTNDVNKYVEIAYNDLLAQGKIGKQVYEIAGEKNTVVIKDDGSLDTAFGNHKLTVNDFRK